MTGTNLRRSHISDERYNELPRSYQMALDFAFETSDPATRNGILRRLGWVESETGALRPPKQIVKEM